MSYGVFSSVIHVFNNLFLAGFSSDNICGEFPKVSNGHIEYSGIYAFVKCDDGFELKGDDTFKCDQHSNSKWNPETTPLCQSITNEGIYKQYNWKLNFYISVLVCYNFLSSLIAYHG